MSTRLRRARAFVRRNRAGTIGAAIVLAFVLIALLAPLVAPDSATGRAGDPFSPPSGSHPLGLDDGGTDVLSLVIWGARVSLLVAFAAALVSVVIGGAIGVIAGYAGSRVDMVLMRVTDYFLVIPVVPLMILIGFLWGTSVASVALIIGGLSWPVTARIVRAQVKSIKQRTFISRTRALGATRTRIVVRHVLPQVAPLLAASTALTVGNAVFFEAALSFLGLGPSGQISWGRMIDNAFRGSAVAAGAWWAIVPPGIAIGLVVLGCSLVGNSMEERFNPRLRVSYLAPRVRRRLRAAGRAHADA
jgi:peptide/nickel transport system permease protein